MTTIVNKKKGNKKKECGKNAGQKLMELYL
jgi:hypothetical protein